MSSTPARFPGGVTNRLKTNALGMLGMPDPTRYHVWFDDFDKYTTADWTLTTVELGAGSATEAIGNADGGILVVTNDAADDDSDFFQLARETFRFETTKDLWFKARLKVSDITQSDFVVGLQITDTTPLAVTDGVYFRKDDGDALLDCVVIKDSAATTATAAATLANDTYYEFAFHFDGKAVYWYLDNVQIAESVLTNLPDDEELTISFGLQNGEAVAKIMSVDYIFVAKER